MKIKYFTTPSGFRRWLEKNHAIRQELWVGYYKKSSGQPSMTWPESVDEALCFGWIDGIRKSVDDLHYTIRFTPRRRGSVWSAVNIKRAEALGDQGLMKQRGMAAFNARKEQSPCALRRKAETKQSSMEFLLCSTSFISKKRSAGG